MKCVLATRFLLLLALAWVLPAAGQNSLTGWMALIENIARSSLLNTRPGSTVERDVMPGFEAAVQRSRQDVDGLGAFDCTRAVFALGYFPAGSLGPRAPPAPGSGRDPRPPAPGKDARAAHTAAVRRAQQRARTMGTMWSMRNIQKPLSNITLSNVAFNAVVYNS